MSVLAHYPHLVGAVSALLGLLVLVLAVEVANTSAAAADVRARNDDAVEDPTYTLPWPVLSDNDAGREPPAGLDRVLTSCGAASPSLN